VEMALDFFDTATYENFSVKKELVSELISRTLWCSIKKWAALQITIRVKKTGRKEKVLVLISILKILIKCLFCIENSLFLNYFLFLKYHTAYFIFTERSKLLFSKATSMV
jgi:hypothetical protein